MPLYGPKCACNGMVEGRDPGTLHGSPQLAASADVPPGNFPHTDREGRDRVTIANIAKNGSDLETLKALRQKIAETLDKSESGRDIAALSRQLQNVLEEIRDLEAAEGIQKDRESVLDQVRARRAKRQ